MDVKPVVEEHYKELQYIKSKLLKNKSEEEVNRVISAFKFIHNNEIVGWRNKQVTNKIVELLLRNKFVLYVLFCPSYKKGFDALGYTGKIGENTKKGIEVLTKFESFFSSLGIELATKAIFFDIAVERFNDLKLSDQDWIHDLQNNYYDLLNKVPFNFETTRLSSHTELMSRIGYEGIANKDAVPNEVYNRILERGRKFYLHFGWDEEQIKERTDIVVGSESYVGNWLRKEYPHSIMLYIPTMLERLYIYSGHNYKTDPLAVICPNMGL